MNQRLLKTSSQWSNDHVYLGWNFISIRYVMYAPWTLSAPLVKPAAAAVIISMWLQSASFRCNLGGPGLSCSGAFLTLWRGAPARCDSVQAHTTLTFRDPMDKHSPHLSWDTHLVRLLRRSRDFVPASGGSQRDRPSLNWLSLLLLSSLTPSSCSLRSHSQMKHCQVHSHLNF